MVSNGGYRYYGSEASTPPPLRPFLASVYPDYYFSYADGRLKGAGLFTVRVPEILVRGYENRSWPKETWEAIEAAWRLGGIEAALALVR